MRLTRLTRPKSPITGITVVVKPVIPVMGLLGLILVLAKVFGYTQLSWWLVTAPFWGPLTIILSVCAIILALGIVVVSITYLVEFITKLFVK